MNPQLVALIAFVVAGVALVVAVLRGARNKLLGYGAACWILGLFGGMQNGLFFAVAAIGLFVIAVVLAVVAVQAEEW